MRRQRDMIGSFRLWRSLLGVSALALLSGCGWFGGGTQLDSQKARPGADRNVAGSGALPSANPGRQYEPGFAATDETRTPQDRLDRRGQGWPEGSEGSGRQGGRRARRQGARGAREARGRRPRGEGQGERKEPADQPAPPPGTSDDRRRDLPPDRPATPETQRRHRRHGARDGTRDDATRRRRRLRPSRRPAPPAAPHQGLRAAAGTVAHRPPPQDAPAASATVAAPPRPHAGRRHGRSASDLHAGERCSEVRRRPPPPPAQRVPALRLKRASRHPRRCRASAHRAAPYRSEQGLRSAARLGAAGQAAAPPPRSTAAARPAPSAAGTAASAGRCRHVPPIPTRRLFRRRAGRHRSRRRPPPPRRRRAGPPPARPPHPVRRWRRRRRLSLQPPRPTDPNKAFVPPAGWTPPGRRRRLRRAATARRPDGPTTVGDGAAPRSSLPPRVGRSQQGVRATAGVDAAGPIPPFAAGAPSHPTRPAVTDQGRYRSTGRVEPRRRRSWRPPRRRQVRRCKSQ